MNLVTSENIITRLKIDITKANLLNSKEDPIQPIMDIILGSIMKYDLETTRVGLKAVTDQVIKIIDSEGEKKISELFCNHLQRVIRLAISRGDVESTVEVIKNLGICGKSTAEKGHEDATSLTAKFLEDVGLTTLDAQYLSRLGRLKTEEGYVDATGQAAKSLGAVGKAAAENGLKDATRQAAWSLVEVGRAAAEKGFEDAIRQAAISLAELTILSEEIVKTTIQKCESRLEEQDRASFQKFMKIYEQELEKLQAKK